MEISKAGKTARDAALQAGKYIKERLGHINKIDYKSAFNIVTDVDQSSEAMILEILRRQFPNDSILAEETGATHKEQSRRWLIDPLDGTTNFTHAYPFFGVSIGLEEEGELVLGVVYNPSADELFMAEKGQGAYLNDERIHVSSISSLNQSLLATGFPPDTENSVENNMAAFMHLTSLCHGVRRDGSAALDLCFVACGRLEGFWERKLSPWDIGAGAIIVTEAGGKVSSLENTKLDLAQGHILASNALIHEEVIAMLQQSSSKALVKRL